CPHRDRVAGQNDLAETQAAEVLHSPARRLRPARVADRAVPESWAGRDRRRYRPRVVLGTGSPDLPVLVCGSARTGRGTIRTRGQLARGSAGGIDEDRVRAGTAPWPGGAGANQDGSAD